MGKKQATQQTQRQTQEGPVKNPVDEMLKEGEMREIFSPDNSPILFQHILDRASTLLYDEEMTELELLIEELKITMALTDGLGDEYSASNDNASIVISKASDPLSPDYRLAYNHVSININVCDRPMHMSWYFLLMPNELDKTQDDASSETGPQVMTLEQFLSGYPDPLTDDHNLQSPILSGIPVWESVYDGKFPTGEGGAGDYVKRLQLALLLINPRALPNSGIDGNYGPETTQAVLYYQNNSGPGKYTMDENGKFVETRKNQLKSDGIVGKQTITKLDADMTRIYAELNLKNAFTEEMILWRLYAYYKSKYQEPPPHETMIVMAQMLLEIRRTENTKVTTETEQTETETETTTETDAGPILDETQTATLLMGGLTAEEINAMTDDELKVWIWEHFKLERPEELDAVFTELKSAALEQGTNLGLLGAAEANKIWSNRIYTKLNALGFVWDEGKVIKTMVLEDGKWLTKTEMIANKFVKVDGLKKSLSKSTKLAKFLEFLDWGYYVDPITFAQALYENDPFVFSPFHDAVEDKIAEADDAVWAESLHGTYRGFVTLMQNKINRNQEEAEWGLPLKEMRILYLTTLEYVNMLSGTFVVTKGILETPRLYPADVYIADQFIIDNSISYAIVVWGKDKNFYHEEIQENTPIGPGTEITPIATFLMKPME